MQLQDNPVFFSLSVTVETCSETKLKTGQIQDCRVFEINQNGCFDLLISGQQSNNPLREAIPILSGRYKRFTFVHPVPVTLDQRFLHKESQARKGDLRRAFSNDWTNQIITFHQWNLV